MPNIASILKDEIVRLARKEMRKELEGLRKASAQYRSDIAGLKRRVADLEKQVSRAAKKAPGTATSKTTDESSTKFRFRAKGLATHRQRLGLSAAEAGVILGVSAQTVYNWEAEKSRPRQSQLAAIAAFRKMGKRHAKGELAKTEG
ncbi:MAG: helix-turn-helix transcriptional regulator [Holophagaceae bacterium]|uniref:Helix-turn-helix transcriptional regulator n=1 Tax=Candidatus Geothrix skivensis TaxID=2954439 RepID=A0A9D7XJ08_9BACT|nr:helix-turn-helix transcriptional regulator [Holophagaceae bacterium]MBK9797238.1 helix-turn-helix transcriptional regulator [Candidatus Geothrix skivensis]